MIAIVAHGIFGTSYRQDIVTGRDLLAPEDLRVLHDIRQDLSPNYNDGSPMTDWAVQPALSGRWFSRIERAFDNDFTPAFMEVSFLIPHGYCIKKEAARRIERCLVKNHAWYIHQKVIQYKTDWGFLTSLGQELESLLEPTGEVETACAPISSVMPACYPNTIDSLLGDFWNEKFSHFSIVYRGNGLLASDKGFPTTDDSVPLKKDPPITQPSAGIATSAGTTSVGSVSADTAGVATKIPSTSDTNQDKVPPLKGFYGVNGDITKPPYKYNGSKRTSKKKSSKKGRNMAIGLLSGVALIIILAALVFSSSKSGTGEGFSHNDTVFVTTPVVDNLEIVMQDTVNAPDSSIDSVVHRPEPEPKQNHGKDNSPVYHGRQGGQGMGGQSDNQTVPTQSKTQNNIPDKVVIATASQLFRCLTWENVKNNGRLFFEKYDVSSPHLKGRANNIIHLAMRHPRSTYMKAYDCAMRSHHPQDRLSVLEESLMGSSKAQSSQSNQSQSNQSQSNL